MRRTITAIIAAAAVVGIGFAVNVITSDDAAAPVAAPHPPAANPDLDRQIDLYESFLADVDDPNNNFRLGRLYLQRAAFFASIPDYERAVSVLAAGHTLAPDFHELAVAYGNALMGVHRFGDAVEVLERVTAAQPGNLDAWLALGDARLERGDRDGAFVAYQPVFDQVGDDPAVIARQAELAHLAGDQDDAVAIAEVALNQATGLGLSGRDLGFFQLTLADLLIDNGAYDRAEEQIIRAVNGDPSWIATHSALGKVRYAQGDLDGARRAYEAAATLGDDPDVFIALAGIAGLDDDLDVSQEYLSRAETVYRSWTPELGDRGLSRLFADQGIRLDEALRHASADFERRQDPLSVDTYAWALYQNGRVDEAYRAILPITVNGPLDADVLYHTGLIAFAAGDDDLAVAALNELLTRNPGFDVAAAEHARDLLETLQDG